MTGMAEGPAKSCNRSVHWSSACSVKTSLTALAHCLPCYPDTQFNPHLCEALNSDVFLLHRKELEIWFHMLGMSAGCGHSCCFSPSEKLLDRLFPLLCLVCLQVQTCTEAIISKYKLEKKCRTVHLYPLIHLHPLSVQWLAFFKKH